MRILFLDAYFEPEQISSTHLEKDLLEALVNDGHDICVICPTPTRGLSKATIKEYRGIRSEVRYGGHVRVTRFLAPVEGRNPLIRAVRYFWCNYRTYQMGKRMTECDLVYCDSTPPTQGWIAGKVARKLKTPLVYSLQDIFPDSLASAGLTNEGSLLWKLGRRIEDQTYKCCSHIIVISDAMKHNLLQKGVDPRKITVINNWIDTEEIRPVMRQDNQLFDEFGVDREAFIVLYAGNFGESQGAEIVLDVAESLQNQTGIRFVIFGGGSGYDRAVRRAESMNNVFIHPLLPSNRISEVYSMGNVALITIKKGIGKAAMPSKTWSIMACNTRIIASCDLDSELCDIIWKSNAGICVEPQNKNELVRAILEEYQMKSGVHTDTRTTVMQIASKNVCTTAYLKQFQASLEHQER